MGFKELNDVDGNGLKDVAQPKPENKFDLSDSDEVADKLKREDLQSVEDSPDKKRLLDKADSAGLEGFPKSLESDLSQDGRIKEKSHPAESALPQSQESATRRTAESIPASLERPDEFKTDPRESDSTGTVGTYLINCPPDGPAKNGKNDDSRVAVSDDSKTVQANVSERDINKLANWTYAPELETYARHKDVFDNPRYYNQETGEINWPINNGFAGEPTREILYPGIRIDRYGSDYGSFAAPENTGYEKRSLPPGTENSQYSVFEVTKPIDVDAGQTAPWFDEPGGGTQYKLPMSVDDLIDDGYLRRLS